MVIGAVKKRSEDEHDHHIHDCEHTEVISEASKHFDLVLEFFELSISE